MGTYRTTMADPRLGDAHNSMKQCSIEDTYEMTDEIGRGQYAVVHRGKHRQTGKEVAVKLINKVTSGATVQDKEIAVMLRIDDPNCVKMYEVYETETEVQMVLELLQGADLFDRIVDKQKYLEAEAKQLIKRVCIGVKTLYDSKIIHRDLKPENILLVHPDDDVTCKVA